MGIALVYSSVHTEYSYCNLPFTKGFNVQLVHHDCLNRGSFLFGGRPRAPIILLSYNATSFCGQYGCISSNLRARAE